MACQFATTFNPRINSKADTSVKIFSKRLGNIGLKGTYCPLPLYSIVIGTVISVAAPALVSFYVGDISEFMGKTCQAAQLTRERFLIA